MMCFTVRSVCLSTCFLHCSQVIIPSKDFDATEAGAAFVKQHSTVLYSSAAQAAAIAAVAPEVAAATTRVG